MPASLLLATPARGVARHESTRSDSSSQSSSTATAAKKVSFNRAVRVKKFPKKSSTDPDDRSDTDSPGKRFWFRVYKNRHRPPRSDVIYYDSEGGGGVSYHPNPSVINYPAFTSECGTQTTSGRSLLGNEFTPLHPSQMPSDPPEVRRNYVKKIVSKFNEEAVLQRQRSTEDSPPVSPPGSPKHHSTPMHIPPPPPPPPVGSYQLPMEVPPLPQGLFTNPRPPKRAPIVNGVKVMFGEPKSSEEKTIPILREDDDRRDSFRKTRSYAVHSDGSETDVKVPYPSQQDTFLFGEQDLAVVKRNGTSTSTLSPARRFDDDDHRDNGYYYNDGEGGSNRRGKYHVDAWDSGPRLVFDQEDVNTSTGKTDKGHFMTTVGEKHQMWQNNKRVVVYEEDSPTIIRRKAKSQSDLRHLEGGKISPEEKLDKGVSTDELFIKSDKKDTLSKKQKDSWLRHFRSATKDKGIQCDKVPTDEPQELYGFGRYKIIRPRNGTVSAFSNVPKLDHNKARTTAERTVADNGYNSKDNSVIYSQIDKSKKKQRNGEVQQKKKNIFSEDGKIGSLFKSRSEPLYIGPPPKSQSHDEVDGSYYGEDRGERTIKTSKKSFGFRLGKPVEPKVRGPVYEEDWYNVDGDLEAAERQKRRGKSHRDISEVRQEIAEEEISDASSLSNGHQQRNGGAGSVMREVDYKKREISYENVPRSEDADRNGHAHPGMWYRDADEDYRREMAQSEVSYPAGNSVGSDRFYTVDRKGGKKPPPSPRAYTLDRRHNGKVANTSGVKILVNGKEVKDKSSGKKSKKQLQQQHREEPSSVQSDPVSVRGGLAAAYQARQRANVRRSNSSVSGMSRYGSSPNIRRIVASSDISAASSESESSRHRRPLVMYIPGVSHPEKASDGEDRVRSSVSRSQSMLAPTRPPRVSKRSSNHRHKGGSRADLYRNGTLDEEDDEIMPLASDSNRKKPPRVPYESKKQRDVKRSNSMPKDTKFSWLKWKIRGKPSREP